MNYEASAAQIQWGGKYSTLAGALGKMAEYYKYDTSGKQQAAQMLEYEQRNNAKPSFATPAPTSTGSSSSRSGASYVSNITINGQRKSLEFADRQSQLDGETLIRALAEGKGVAQ